MICTFFSVNCFSHFVCLDCTYVLKYCDRHIFHHVPLHGEYRFMCCLKNHKSVRRLASFKTTQKGNSDIFLEGLVGLFVYDFIF